ncbi:STAS domain-containing protein [Asanoa sp. WMMD1127]|uniref:STAS domain-containing protein n=1 Tax=Asanoa sp. WMMD1127 TaxID=3016107 RepID=UPI002417C076|nr:STAS domain-containing protein [Asanoa sp. WMMD1127]MDG4820848.1 STAS domain-containing protein [Asanoa sp. WMMD1127]
MTDEVVLDATEGALDAHTAGDLGEGVTQAIALADLTPHRRLLVDLRHLESLAAAGARALRDAAVRCAGHGVQCHVVAPTGHDSRRVLDRLDVGPLLRIIDDDPTLADPTDTGAFDESYLAVETHRSDGMIRLVAFGDIDMETADELERALHEAVTAEPARPTIVDLAGVAFLDSTGIRVLVQAKVRAEARGVSFGITNPQPNVARVLEITAVLTALTALDHQNG